MKKIILLIILFNVSLSYSQINPLDVEIVRDNFGVPHIFGKTDADVAYGLAWSHAEDDFKTIQQGYLAGLLHSFGEVLGLFQQDTEAFFDSDKGDDVELIKALISARNKARDDKDWGKADQVRDELKARGIILEDAAGKTIWRRT
jgi:cysteinyl-tRNA synthetase